MKIKEVSKVTGLSIYTLHYYEKRGLLTISRDDSGHRDYSEQDILWIEFIVRLKNTGMPIREILNYSDLRREGDSTMISRLNILYEHEKAIIGNIKYLENNLEILRNKIQYYKKALKK